MIRLIVAGCHGRMGTAVCRLAAENAATTVVAGTDIIEMAAAFPVYADINQCAESADAIISFLPPTADAETLEILLYSVRRQIPLVLCTTGMSSRVEAMISQASEKVAILRSANMSLGVNLLSSLLKRVSKLLHEANFDIEITEKHHNQKLDAPSGTAILLADAVNDALDGKMRYVNDRSTSHKKRDRDEIGIHALRGGTIIGEHTVTFAGASEVIELSHSAGSRDIFATGAIKAAEFLQKKPAGIYSMLDVIEQ